MKYPASHVHDWVWLEAIKYGVQARFLEGLMWALAGLICRLNEPSEIEAFLLAKVESKLQRCYQYLGTLSLGRYLLDVLAYGLFCHVFLAIFSTEPADEF